MGTRKRYTYHPRKTRTGYVWEYSINEEAGIPTTWCEHRKSSGISVSFGRNGKPTHRSQDDIIRYCNKRIDELREQFRESLRKRTEPTLWEIIEPYYDYDRCPHIERLLTDGREISRRWAADQRQRLINHVQEHRLGKKKYTKLLPADFEAWKRDLRKKGVKISVINKTLTALKTALGEEYNQKRIDYYPLMGISQIKTKEAERGYFTLEELYRMFVSEAPGCWKAQRDAGSKYGKIPAETAWFMGLFHFLTGERMKAILDLRWQDIEFGTGIVTYKRTKTQTGRMAPLPQIIIDALREHSDRSIRISPADYIFSYDTGKQIGYTFFTKRYKNMIDFLELPKKDPDGYERTPYSLKVSLETHLIDAAADPIHVREYMGHSHDTGEKRLTRVQVRYKRRRVEVIRKIIIPIVDKLLNEVVIIEENK